MKENTQAGQDDGHENDDKQKTCAAAGVVLGLGPHVLHRQGEARLIAEDGLVLRPMVLEGAADILHVGTQNQVAQEDDHPQKPLHQVPPPQGEAGNEVEDGAPQGGGQQEKEEHGKGHAQNHGKGDEQAGEFLVPQLPVQPLFEFGGLGGLLVVLGKNSAEYIRAVTPLYMEEQKFTTPRDEGPGHKGMAGLEDLPGLGLDLQLPVGLAHHYGFFGRGPSS